jgi:hypothetical protein
MMKKAKYMKIKEVKDADYFTVDEAAQALGIKPTAIRNYLYWGYFTTFKFKTFTLLSRQEVEQWKERQK